jgi:hypothetical protein
MHNPSINILLYITTAEGYFKLITSLNMHTTSLKEGQLDIRVLFIVSLCTLE